jgi:hypothetical protein
MDKSFCFFFQKEVLFFFEKKNQKTFTRLTCADTSAGILRPDESFYGIAVLGKPLQ